MEQIKAKISETVGYIKNNWPYITAGICAAVLLLSYLSGLLLQLQSSGNSLMDGGDRTEVSKSLFRCVRLGLGTPQGRRISLGISAGLIVIGFVFYISKRFNGKGEYDPDRNFEYSDKNTYGTAGWMSKKEMHNALDVKRVEQTYGIILGALGGNVVSIVPTIRDDSVFGPSEADKLKSRRTNKHVCILGASGSMKSRAYVRPAIFQCVRRRESMIITDPKGEMYEDMSELLKNEGYIVKVFNLKDQAYSDSWDCLAEVDDEVMAQTFCAVIIQNTGGARGDHFWDNSEMNLLKALVLYVVIENRRKGLPVTIAEVYRLLTVQKAADLEIMFRALPQTHPAYVPYSIYAQAGDNVRGNIIIGLASRIQVFQSQVTKNITSFPEIDLTLPGKEKCAYFCAISDQESTFSFLSSLFFSFLFIRLVKYADNYGRTPGKLDVPVNFILDEFSNIGTIPDFEKKISTVRSRDINISVIIQNIPQLKSRYPNDVWQEIIGNCDTQLFLGCTDETTAKYISDRSGMATIDIQSEQTIRKTFALAQVIPEYKNTSSVGKRNVLTQDEVLRLPGTQALVIIRGEKLLKVEKYDYTRHPWAKRIIPSRMCERIPRWHRREIEAEAVGLELRTERRGAGNLYYVDAKTGVAYERTAYINADSAGELVPVIPKGETVKISSEKTSGYQIIRSKDGMLSAVNIQTGETRPYYGFDARGQFLDRPASSITGPDENVTPEASGNVVCGSAEPDPFDRLIEPRTIVTHKNTASLDPRFLSAADMSKKSDGLSFDAGGQGLGSGTPIKDKPFGDTDESLSSDYGEGFCENTWDTPEEPKDGHSSSPAHKTSISPSQQAGNGRSSSETGRRKREKKKNSPDGLIPKGLSEMFTLQENTPKKPDNVQEQNNTEADILGDIRIEQGHQFSKAPDLDISREDQRAEEILSSIGEDEDMYRVVTSDDLF